MTRPVQDRQRWRARATAAIPGATDDFLDELTDHLLARRSAVLTHGGSEAEADRAAMQELAAWAGVTPPARPERRALWVGGALDWRSAMRLVCWRPAFATSVILLLTIGIGAASTASAVLYGVLGRPLPYPDADRLVTVWERSLRNGTGQLSFPDARDLARSGVFDSSAVFVGGVGTLTGGAVPTRVNALFTEPAMLDMLGAAPVLGRLYTASDIGGDAAVISHRLWHSQFGGAADVVGRRFQLSGTSLTIVGVLGPGFDFEVPVARTFLLSDHDVWRVFDGPGAFESRRDVSTYQMLARLAPDATIARVTTALDGTAARLAAAHPSTNGERSFLAHPLRNIVTEAARPALTLAAAAAALLLVAALASVGGLALVRATGRQPEMAIRRALGASPGALVRHVIVEQLPLVAVSLCVGLLAGRWATLTLAGSRAVRLPRPEAITFDAVAWMAGATVAALALVVLAATGLVATRGGRASLASSRVLGSGSRRVQRGLVITEVALALVLCTTAAIVGLTLLRLIAADAGFTPQGRLTFRVSAFAADFPDRTQVIGVFNALSQALLDEPHVERVALSSSLPLSGHFNGSGVVGRSGEHAAGRVTGGWQHVTPGYFDTAGIGLLRGRDFTDVERASDAHVSILSASMARRLFGSIDAVGEHVQAGGGEDWHEVVGVVEDVRHRSLAEAEDLRIYDLNGQHWGRTLFVIVQTREGAEAAVMNRIRQVVAGVSPAVPVFEVATGVDLRQRSTSPQRLAAALASAAGLAALLIAVFGIHAIVAFSVSQRRREIGVRMALGATRAQVARLVFWEAGSLAVAGWIAGLVLVAAAVQGLATVIPDLTQRSPWPVALIVCALVGGAAVVAATPAAWRAVRVDPVRELTS